MSRIISPRGGCPNSRNEGQVREMRVRCDKASTCSFMSRLIGRLEEQRTVAGQLYSMLSSSSI
eukprot:9026206-Heterocapsa_arctica.AAC.1